MQADFVGPLDKFEGLLSRSVPIHVNGVAGAAPAGASPTVVRVRIRRSLVIAKCVDGHINP